MKLTRRDFLKNIGRGALLGAVTLAGVKLIKENQVTFKECEDSYICKKCLIVKNCDLPQALSYRLYQG